MMEVALSVEDIKESLRVNYLMVAVSILSLLAGIFVVNARNI